MTQSKLPKLEASLGLRDLVLFNLVAVLGITWVATGAKAGPSSVTLWLFGAFLFFIPQGLAVVQLASSYPEEGGIYAWTRRELGEAHGFLCGWCYWINNVLYYPTLLLGAAVAATFVIGQSETGHADRWGYVLPFTLVGLLVAMFLNVMGVRTGRWLQNIGGLSTALPGLLLVLLGLYRLGFGNPVSHISLSQLWPDLTDFATLNLWATIAFAFAGLELSSTMATEIKDPIRNLPRSLYIAAPLVAVIYIIGTCAMLWLVPRDQINVVAGPLQGIAIGTQGLGNIGAFTVGSIALLLTVARIGAVGAWLTGSSRVAFAVGVDRYLPPAFSRLHPRWRTPYIAILVQGVIATVFLFISVLGKGTTVETAFLILIDMSLLIYFIPYLYLFACFVLFCCRARNRTRLVVIGGKPGAIAIGGCGFAITIFAMVVAMFPPAGTASVLWHEIKLGGGALLLVSIGLIVFWRARRKAPNSASRA